uniref:SAM domain-containing protein n=1 Tax=Plectus sambesii TaxID=2011161 RepID=A0A914W0D1_9BILA
MAASLATEVVALRESNLSPCRFVSAILHFPIRVNRPSSAAARVQFVRVPRGLKRPPAHRSVASFRSRALRSIPPISSGPFDDAIMGRSRAVEVGENGGDRGRSMGDANKTDVWGNSSLHLAATNNHMNCVSFLVNFGVNLWTLDNEQRSVIDVAAMKGNHDVVKYLDSEMARQTVLNPKETSRNKQKAIAECERRAHRLEQKMAKHWTAAAAAGRPEPKAPSSPSVVQSQHRWLPAPDPLAKSLKALERKFNETLRSVGVSGRQDAASTKRDAEKAAAAAGGGRLEKNSQVFYASSEENGGADSGISVDLSPEPPSLFDRPGFGTVSFRSTSFMSDTLINMDRPDRATAHSPAGSSSEWNAPWSEDLDLSDHLTDDCSPIEAFLDSISIGLAEYAIVFMRERVTLESLLLLDEKDLQELKIPLGPRKLIIDALNKRRKDLEHISKRRDESSTPGSS